MREFVEYVARSIVDDPEQVRVEEEERGNTVLLRLLVADADMGRVIGKQGRIAQAMRTLLKTAAVKEGRHVSLEIG